jgi:hypothetical protein
MIFLVVGDLEILFPMVMPAGPHRSNQISNSSWTQAHGLDSKPKNILP